ncbi:putative transcription repressor PLATZ family [Rosa chinensis]|uniref:Putative transcription repressor PLATZ family n=1 Tax=Rosa chinensis TaxID=74649 RepID=A0A2P6R3W3_ROSCH|nr:putative transcription repressor PLATZ family [Rosa chinensis]
MFLQKNDMVVPQWLKIMYSTVFFETCITHSDAKKNDIDHFCIDCLQPICLNCLAQHMFHKHIKIQRYIYSDVINCRDLCKLFNCSGIQTYQTNKAKVVFLKQRHQPQQQEQQRQHYNKSGSICVPPATRICKTIPSIAVLPARFQQYLETNAREKLYVVVIVLKIIMRKREEKKI